MKPSYEELKAAALLREVMSLSETHPHLVGYVAQLEERRKESEAGAAVMREALESARSVVDDLYPDALPPIDAALSTDAGRSALEELRRLRAFSITLSTPGVRQALRVVTQNPDWAGFDTPSEEWDQVVNALAALDTSPEGVR